MNFDNPGQYLPALKSTNALRHAYSVWSTRSTRKRATASSSLRASSARAERRDGGETAPATRDSAQTDGRREIVKQKHPLQWIAILEQSTVEGPPTVVDRKLPLSRAEHEQVRPPLFQQQRLVRAGELEHKVEVKARARARGHNLNKIILQLQKKSHDVSRKKKKVKQSHKKVEIKKLSKG